MKQRFLLVLLGFMLVHNAVCAGECPFRMYPDQTVFDPSTYTTPNSICIFPDGRTTLNDAVSGNCNLYYGLLLDEYDYDSGWHHTNYPEQGLLLAGQGATLVLCDTTTAYLRSDAAFLTIGSQPIHGGGHSAISVGGQPIASAIAYWAPDPSCGVFAMQLYFNSPDINGDLRVNLADTIILSSDLSGTYNYRSDFNWDGLLNLSDVAIYSSAVGVSCD